MYPNDTYINPGCFNILNQQLYRPFQPITWNTNPTYMNQTQPCDCPHNHQVVMDSRDDGVYVNPNPNYDNTIEVTAFKVEDITDE